MPNMICRDFLNCPRKENCKGHNKPHEENKNCQKHCYIDIGGKLIKKGTCRKHK